MPDVFSQKIIGGPDMEKQDSDKWWDPTDLNSGLLDWPTPTIRPQVMEGLLIGPPS